MKFGRNLPRNQVPQWANEYIDYKGLKKLIKSAEARTEEEDGEVDLAEFFFTLDRNLETVDYFYNKKYAEVKRRLRLLFDRYGENPPSTNESERHDLNDVVNALLDLRTRLRNLQWYGEVNRRGFTKILKKLDKKVTSAKAQARYLESRVDPRPFANNHDLTQDMSSINAWLSKVGEINPQDGAKSETSSISISAPLQNLLSSFPPEILTQLDHALMDDDVSDLSVALKAFHAAAEGDKSVVQRVLLSFLQRAISYCALQCIPTILGDIDGLRDEEDFHNRNCVHRLLINVGRLRSVEAGHDFEGSSPTLSALHNIAPAEAPALDLNPYGPKEVDSSRPRNDQDKTAKLIEVLLDNFSDAQKEALVEVDDSGRLPLHYAAKYGFVDVCQTIMTKMTEWNQLDSSNGMDSINWKDTDGYTPLHLAVIGGWRLTTEVLLEACGTLPGLEKNRPFLKWRDATALVSMATQAGFDKTVAMLVKSGSDINVVDDHGEVPMHIAARFGHMECARAMLKEQRDPSPNLEIAENTFGWTPLLIACVDGQLDMVKLLTENGADPAVLDSSGWSAKEHAALRGHMEIAEHLNQMTPRIMPASPDLSAAAAGSVPRPHALDDRGSGASKENSKGKVPSAVKSFGHRYLRNESMVLVSLGSMDARKNQKPIELDSIPLAEAHATQLDTALSVVVSAKGANGEPFIVDLPVQENISTESFAFNTKDISKVKLYFDIVPTYAGSNDDKIGRAVAVLSTVKTSVGSKRTNLQGDLSVPIVATKTMEVIGTVHFNFLIVTPFEHENMSISEAHTYWKTLAQPMVIGHRGLGKNLRSNKSLQLGENTLQSFIAAANLGASYVEFDVQLTKDLVPVLYHDFLVSETGIDAPVHALTLEQFLHVNDPRQHQSRGPSPARGQQNGTNGREPDNEVVERRHRANSAGAIYSPTYDNMSERMKHTRDFKLKGYKGNSRGNFIQAPFTTLEEMFRKMPESTGFNIEMKYPMLFESEAEGMDTYAVELNTFVDTVLKMVYDLAGERRVIFSSFHPDLCLLLSLKQPSIPILFLTDAGVTQVGDIRASSLQEAIRFASRWNLLGIVAASEPLVMCPRLVRVVKESGLVCVSYGVLNNDPENVKTQVREGIDAVIVDSVLAVRKGLTTEEKKNVANGVDEKPHETVSQLMQTNGIAQKVQEPVVTASIAETITNGNGNVNGNVNVNGNSNGLDKNGEAKEKAVSWTKPTYYTIAD